MRVLVLSDASFIDADGFDAVVLGVETTADVHKFLHLRTPLVRLNDVVTDYEPLEHRAYQLAQGATRESPRRHGVSLLDTYRAPLAEELFRFAVIQQLHAFLANEFPAGTQFHVHGTDLPRGLRLCSPRLEIEPVATPLKPLPRWQRRIALARNMLGDGLRHQGLQNLWFLALEQADSRYQVRRALYRNRRRPNDGAAWIISSYESYSRVLQAYAQTLERSPYALTFSESGRASLQETLPPEHIYSYWDFTQSQKQPYRTDVELASAEVETALRYGLANDGEARLFLTGGPFWSDFRGRVLSILIALTDAVKSFFERAVPTLVATANQYSFAESIALALATRWGLPTLQIQHGVLEAFYRYDTVRSDHFLVASDYWRDLLPESERAKAEVRCFLFAPGYAPSPRWGDSRESVTFFTASMGTGTTPFVDSRLDSSLILQALLRVLQLRDDITLLIRVHPTEPVTPWVELWDSIPEGQKLRNQGRVQFDKRSSITSIARRTRVAVTYFSSVFVECLRQGIPMVSIGWYARPTYRQDFERMGVWRSISSIESLEAEVLAALDAPMPWRPEPAFKTLASQTSHFMKIEKP